MFSSRPAGSFETRFASQKHVHYPRRRADSSLTGYFLLSDIYSKPVMPTFADSRNVFSKAR